MSYQLAYNTARNPQFMGRIRIALVIRAKARFAQATGGEAQLVRDILTGNTARVSQLVDTAAFATVTVQAALDLLTANAAAHTVDGVIDYDALQAELPDNGIQTHIDGNVWQGLIRA